VIQEHFNDLVIATYGRGFYILDDLSPLQKMTPQVMASNATLFAPRPAYRFKNIQGNVSQSDDPTAGQNPQYGAAINYWLKSAPQAATIAVLDATGKTVRSLQATRNAGLNRVYWDLSNEPSKSPRMRTKPVNDPDFRMNADGTRNAPGFGTLSVLMPPGKYSVKLTVDGQSYTQPLTVLRDPNQRETEADIVASTNLLKSIQADMNTAAEVLGTTESARAQILALGEDIRSKAAELRPLADSVEQKFMTVGANVVDPRLTGRGQDEVRYPVKIGGQLNWLAGGVSASDFTPASQQRDVAGILAKQTRDTRDALQKLVAGDLARLNAQLRAKGLKTIDLGSVVF